MSKHTPPPWEVYEGGNFLKIRSMAKPYNEAGYLNRETNGFICDVDLFPGFDVKAALPDAEFIVRAVNAYETHVKLLRRAQAEIARAKDHNCWSLCDDIQAAIANAEVRP